MVILHNEQSLKESNKMSFRTDLRNFGENISIRGIPKIFKSENWVTKISWLICVLSSTAIVVWQMVSLFQQYFNWPFISLYSDGADNWIAFPDITICNLFPLGKITRDGDSWNDYTKFVSEELANYTLDISNFNSSLTEETLRGMMEGTINSQMGYIINLPVYKTFDNYCPKTIFECRMYDWDWGLADSCDSEIKSVWTPRFHRCSQLHINDSISKDIRGVSMLINVHDLYEKQINFFSDLIQPSSTGIWFYVHKAGTRMDQNRGYLLTPGKQVTVNIYPTIRKRLTKPYSTYGCTDEEYVQLNRSQSMYTYEACYDLCVQNLLIELCGCYSSYFDIDEDMLDERIICGNFSYFSNNQTHLKSILDQLLCSFDVSHLKDICDEQCLDSCNDIVYSVDVTSAQWPSASYHRSFFDKYIAPCLNEDAKLQRAFSQYTSLFYSYEQGNISEEELTRSMRSETTIAGNFLAVKFIVRNEYPFTLADKAQFTWQTMMSLVGGCLSLWLGITIMTAVEIVEFVSVFISKIFVKIKTRRRVGSTLRIVIA